MNKINILKPPINPPSNNFLIFIFRLKIIEVAIKRRKSKAKFKMNIKSKYNFILSPFKV